MHYGKSIVVAFILFAMFIGTLVTVCIREDVNLVSPDYYEEELAHGQKMTALANAYSLERKPEISFGAEGVRISYENFSRMESGELKILRPGDKKLDHLFEIQPTTKNEMAFDVRDYAPGLYRIQMKWKMDGKEYMIEEIRTQ